jgi:hypothetical protein
MQGLPGKKLDFFVRIKYGHLEVSSCGAATALSTLSIDTSWYKVAA